MDIWMASEEAYKNGYDKGYEACMMNATNKKNIKDKLIGLLETIPHHQRLYPDLFVDMLIENGVVI